MIIKFVKPSVILKLIRFWPPYFGAGIYVQSTNSNLTAVKVGMKHRFFNTNYVGTHFGGSLYSMCDPFLMFMLLHHLRKDHIVWDRSASIEYLRPAKGEVSVSFKITLEEIKRIEEGCLNSFCVEPEFNLDVLDNNGVIVARVRKKLYVRRKDAKVLFKKS